MSNFDDIIVDGSGHQGTNIHVLNALPISDNTNSNWRKGGGTTTGTDFWEAVNNVPPAGLASASETDTTNVESASSTGTANYVANMQSYTTIGLAASDTVYMVRSVLRHGEDISTGTKTGTVQITANPAEGAATAMNFGLDGGAHGTSNASTTKYITDCGPAVQNPSVTYGTSPTLKVVKTDTTTRVACVDYMAVRVVYGVAISGSD